MYLGNNQFDFTQSIVNYFIQYFKTFCFIITLLMLDITVYKHILSLNIFGSATP